MASWNSIRLQVVSNVFGWIAFFSWSISNYPQVILNFQRKSVVGLNFDFAVLNFTKQLLYVVYNASMCFSSTVQKQYRKKYGPDEMLPVAANDLAFAMHAALVTGFTLFQITIYDRGNQKVPKISIAIVLVFYLTAAICVFIAIPKHSWFWLVSCFNTMQVVMTVIKYVPQAFFNFQRKSTSGFSIGNVLLDLLGGIANCIQMGMQSIDQGSFGNFLGNLGKTLLSLVTLFFDVVFIVQHYVLYPSKKACSEVNAELPGDIEENYEKKVDQSC
ncbi:putative membrane protein [Handroanthus impetiginosus]|uniref:Cystinosin homolog n=1 Tax=Handroanthus impetiginosus TaxID=429701 RepID=A0A2G9GP82_9LAMI|nr:putative membrane protein [Handroanthus impetiginosus]